MTKKIVKKGVLFIAYAFPPIPYSGTFRSFRACKRLSEIGYRVHVLTIKEYDDIPNDYDLLSRTPKSIMVHRTPIFDPWRKFQAWRKKKKDTILVRVLGKVISILLRPITLPDHHILWLPFAVVRGFKVIREEELEAIFVSSPPSSSQLIGYLLKKLSKKAWVADLRDPMVGNAFVSGIEGRILRGLEKLIAGNADSIVTTTEVYRDDLRKRYPATKVFAVRNSFDEDDFENSKEQKYSTFTIAHIGSMYGERSADILFKALKILEERLQPDRLQMNVLFVGLNENDLISSAAKYNVEEYVTIKDLVPHRECIDIMMRSHLLLLIKASGINSHRQIPAKFYEYLGTGNKILYLGPKETEASKIIEELDAGYIIENDVEKLANILDEHYKCYLKGQCLQAKQQDLSLYNSKTMGNRLANVIETTIK